MKTYKIQVDTELLPLVPDFLKNRWADLKAMRENLAKGNMIELQRSGHLLQGTPGCFGFYYMVELGKKIELAASEGDTAALGVLIDRFEFFMNNHTVVDRRNPSKSA